MITVKRHPQRIISHRGKYKGKNKTCYNLGYFSPELLHGIKQSLDDSHLLNLKCQLEPNSQDTTIVVEGQVDLDRLLDNSLDV